jgi:hypothetical protein
MNQRQDRSSPWLLLAGEMFRLPFRMLGLGVQLMTRTGQEVQRLVEGGTGGRTSGDHLPATFAPTAGFAAPRPAPAYAPPISQPNLDAGTDRAAVPASAVPNPAETTNREEKVMSCDKDLSGTDLKIIEYTIVSVDPNIEDDNLRILQPMTTVATTEDLNENGFIAWVIAIYFQQPEHRRLGEGENWKQYLRVCYCVQCRMPIPTVDCCQEQANALRDINRTLRRHWDFPKSDTREVVRTGHYSETVQASQPGGEGGKARKP